MEPLSYIEISRENIRHNYQLFRGLLPESTTTIAVVKANAYGHGVREVVSVIDDLAEMYFVDDFDELAEIRPLTQKRVLVGGYVLPGQIAEAIHLGGELVIYDTERLRELEILGAQLGRRLPIHIKVDAALGRQGLVGEQLTSFLAELKRSQWVEPKSYYGHFANLEDTHSLDYAELQIAALSQAGEEVQATFPGLPRHISATAGILLIEPKYSHPIVRLGIGLYGLWPSAAIQKEFETPGFILKPALRWVSHIAQIKSVPTGTKIGYGLTYTASRPTRLAIVPQGYSDGFDRRFSNKGNVLIAGRRSPVVGRVAMNMMAVDVTELPGVKAGNEVVLLGSQGYEQILAEEFADQLATINYEIIARISPRLPRILV